MSKLYSRCNTDIKENSKLIHHETAQELKRRQSILPFKNISLMKSKLPPSHFPNAHLNDSQKEDKLADKLQAMHRHDSVEETIKSEDVHSEGNKMEPKFLIIDTSQESLDELARIDEELANFNDNSADAESTFRYEEIKMPPISGDYEFTLVLDLDETLIHYNDEGYYLIRPGVITFLDEAAKYYEIIIFTAAMKDYADVIIDQIDPKRHIKHRLYRQH